MERTRDWHRARHVTNTNRSLSRNMAPLINKTLAVLAVTGVGVLAYAIYFDRRRRTDSKFRKHLRTSNFVSQAIF